MSVTKKKKPIIALSGINFAFARMQDNFFEDLSVFFSPHKMHFIHGRNGVGKSTLFRILQGCIEPSESISGTYLFDGIEYTLTSAHDMQNISGSQVTLVQQKFDAMIADQFTFDENLRFANMPYCPTLSPLPKAETLESLIAQFNIPHDQPAALLSGGQRQILAIAMVLQKYPKVLLLDEPTAALDETNANMVLLFLQELLEQLGLTVIIISHDKELSMRYADGSYFELKDRKLHTIDIS